MPATRLQDDQRLQRRHQSGDRQALTEMVERYLPLTRSLALRYRRTGEPVDDLIQVASIGLLKALRRWDPDRGVAFSSYAVPTITGELRRYLRDYTWAVKPPRATQELALVVGKVSNQMWSNHARPATVAELADSLGRSHEDVRDAVLAAAAHRSVSMDNQIAAGDDDTTSLLDGFGECDPGYGRVEDAATLEELTAVLDARAREVLRLRFREDLVQREIAERVGCSQMQVSRIIRDSLNMLRLHARRHGQLGLVPG